MVNLHFRVKYYLIAEMPCQLHLSESEYTNYQIHLSLPA
ncbi:hypothetical protein ES332_D04G215200v1 [Gossypium tomentosum]|uniref:Uncharacterized protein n=1 Tax=Gossypium tomentosum TaxID=34277 RepID=A0A5D2LG15_GOSTO|nr:hypothetical protein ES332_D04G215200v1 [Gossypium tomentosum]